MLVRCAVVLIVTARCLSFESGNSTAFDTAVPDVAAEEPVAPLAPSAEPSPAEVPLEIATTSTQLRSGRGRRNPRRPRGYYNDFRFRNNAYNPYNPNSPFAFRGRPRQLPPADYYGTQYYQQVDPYQQGYYQYPAAYPQAGYYGYPYQPAQPPPPPPTPPPTESLPDLYYVQAADSPDGHYQYRKVSIAQENYGEGRGRRFRGTRWPAQTYGQVPQGYPYNYPYDPYNRRGYPPQPQPPYYPQQGYYPQQWPQQYSYPRGPRASRSRLRTGKPPFRGAAVSPVWKLTPEPSVTQPTVMAAEESGAPDPVTEQNTGV